MSKLEGFANLKAGDSFKNYLEVCAAVGEEKKTGNGQIAQVKRWEEMVEWARVGRRWRVVRVRSALERKDRETARKLEAEGKLNADIAINQRKWLLVEELRNRISEDGLAIVFGFPELDSLLGLVNERFDLEKRTGDEIEFCSEIRNKNKEVTLALCESVIKGGLAEGYKSYEITFKSGEILVLNKDDLYIIADLHVEVYEQMEILTGDRGKANREIHLKGKWKEFYDLRQEILSTRYDITNLRSVFVFFTTQRLCNWFLKANTKSFEGKSCLKKGLNSVNMAKLEEYYKKYIQDRLRITVPKLDGEFRQRLDNNGVPEFELIESRYGRPTEEDFLMRKQKMLNQRVKI